jgi:hypothetical protein
MKVVIAALGLSLTFAPPLLSQTPSPGCSKATTLSATDYLPIRIENNHVHITVCVAGEPHDFALDTGAGQSFIDLGLAQSLGLHLGTRFAARGVGSGTIDGAQLDSVDARIAGTSIPVRIRAALDFARLPGARISGILGYDFIAAHVVVIDYANARMRVMDGSQFRYDGAGTELRLTFANNHPHVDGAIRLADGETIPGRFVIDVGAAGALALSKPFVDSHGLRRRVGTTLRRPGGAGVGGQTVAEFGRISALRFGSLELDSPIAALHGDSSGVLSSGGTFDGNVGGEILRHFTVYLDYPHSRMFLEPNSSFAEPFEIDMTGMGFTPARKPDGRVAWVLPNTPATSAGIQPGDIVLAVDGQELDERVFVELLKRSRRPDERIGLKVRRGTESMTVTLVTRRLI